LPLIADWPLRYYAMSYAITLFIASYVAIITPLLRYAITFSLLPYAAILRHYYA